MKTTTKKGVIRTAQRAVNALKDLHEDAHTVNETRDTARGFLNLFDSITQIERFINYLQNNPQP